MVCCGGVLDTRAVLPGPFFSQAHWPTTTVQRESVHHLPGSLLRRQLLGSLPFYRGERDQPSIPHIRSCESMEGLTSLSADPGNCHHCCNMLPGRNDVQPVACRGKRVRSRYIEIVATESCLRSSSLSSSGTSRSHKKEETIHDLSLPSTFQRRQQGIASHP